MYMRSDRDEWREGVKTMENFFAIKRGPARSRFGFRFLLNESDPAPPFPVCSPDTATFVNNYDYNVAETNFKTGVGAIVLSDDGTQLFGASTATTGFGAGIYQWALGTPFRLDTVVYAGFFEFGLQGSGFAPRGIGINKNGTKLWVYEANSGPTALARIYQLSMSTPLDVTTCSIEKFSEEVDTVNAGATSFVMSYNNDFCYLVNNNTSLRIDQYRLNTPEDIDTLEYMQSKVMSDIPDSAAKFLRIGAIDRAGKNLIADGMTGANFEVLTMSAENDISTCVYDRTIGTNQTANTYGAYWEDQCTYVILSDSDAREFDGYDLG